MKESYNDFCIELFTRPTTDTIFKFIFVYLKGQKKLQDLSKGRFQRLV